MQFSVILADRLLRARDRVALPDRHDSLLVVQDEPGRGSRSRRPAPGTYPYPSRSRLKFNLFFYSLPFFLIGHPLGNCSICRRSSARRRRLNPASPATSLAYPAGERGRPRFNLLIAFFFVSFPLSRRRPAAAVTAGSPRPSSSPSASR